MIRSFAPCLSIVLTLLVAVTAIHAGAMRGQAKAAGLIVLCTGSGPVSVAVDADGQPVGSTHVCPDCVMSVIAAADGSASLPRRIAMARRLCFGPTPMAGRSRHLARPCARGPPRLS
jgi:hypothetical protein